MAHRANDSTEMANSTSAEDNHVGDTTENMQRFIARSALQPLAQSESRSDSSSATTSSTSSPLPRPYDVTKPITEFTLFPNLSPEIRVMIWKMSMPGGRIVEVRWKEGYGYYTNDSIPTLLHVNQEARAEALKRFKAIEFENQDLKVETETEDASEHHEPCAATTPTTVNISTFGTYFDYNLDKLYVFRRNISTDAYQTEANNFFQRLAPEAAASLQCIIICDCTFSFHPDTMVFPGARNLKQVSIVIDDPCWISWSYPEAGREVAYQPLIGHEMPVLEPGLITVLRWVTENPEKYHLQERKMRLSSMDSIKKHLIKEGADREIVQRLEVNGVRIFREADGRIWLHEREI